ncbi:MAG TPA: hypothetical protein P5565_04955 [Bacteroidia bacterium]|nr:hypothetical protein [Bacteroidia bacterium]
MRRSRVRLILSLLLLLLAGGLGLHWWLVRHTEEILQELVRQESDGKVALQVTKARLRYRAHRVSLENVRLFSRDTAEGHAAFDLHFKSVDLQLASFSDMIFRGLLVVPVIEVSRPVIEVLPSGRAGQRISLSEELGDVYIYIQKTLNNLQVQNLHITDGTFALASRQQHNSRISIFNIGLQVNNFRVDPGDPDSSRFFFSDDVQLTTGRESIRFPDSVHVLHYKDLRLSTRSRIVELDSCIISGTSRDSIQGSFELQFERIRLVDVDFSTLYREGRLRMDSLQCTLPVFRLDLVRRQSANAANTRAVLSRLASKLAGDLDIKHASLLRSKVSIQVRKGDKTLPFRTENDDFYIRGLRIKQDQDPAIAVDAFDFFLRDYISYTADSLYSIRFDSIRIRDEALVLTNLRLQPAKPSRDGSVRTLNVPAFVLRDVDWSRLLLERELSANEAVLQHPVIRIVNTRSPGTVSAQAKETVAALSNWVLLKNLKLEDASIDVENKSSGTHLQMNELVAQLIPGDILKAPSFENLEAGLRALNVATTRIETPALRVDLGGLNYSGNKNSWTAASVNFQSANGRFIGQCDRMLVRNLQLPDKQDDVLRIGALSWESGSLRLQESPEKGSGRKRLAKLPALRIDSVRLQNTSLEGALRNEGSVSTFIQQAGGAGISISPNGDWSGSLTDLVGSGGAWMRPGATVRWQSMRQEDGGTVRANGVSCAVNGAADSIFASIPALRFRMSASGEGRELLHASFLEIPDAVLRFRHFPKIDSLSASKRQLWKLLIHTLQVHRAELDLESGDERKLRLVAKAAQLRAEPLRFRSDGSLFFGSTDLQLEHWQVESDDGRKADGRSGRLKIQCDSLSAGGNTRDGWTAAVRKLVLQHVGFFYKNRSRELREVMVDGLEANSLLLNPQLVRSPERWWPEQKRMELHNASFHWHLKESELSLANAAWSAATKHFTAEDVSFRPYLSPDSFLSARAFETDYLRLHRGRLELEELDLDFLEETRFRSRKATVSDAFLEVRRDKRLPDPIGQLKPLPVQQLMRLGFDFRIDTFAVTNGHVEYTEIGDKSGQPGTVSFDRLQATLTGIRSRDVADGDSLRLKANARFLDTTDIALRFRESYLDTLGGFVLTAAIAPFDLRVLNPVIEPIAATRIKRGILDTLRMRVTARDYLSRGEMQFYFRELNVDFSNPEKKFSNILASPVNLIADLFVIRRNNRSQPGLIFYPRNREKSIFNYWVKLALSGVLTSTGARSNGKYERQYARQLEELQLPPIEQ